MPASRRCSARRTTAAGGSRRRRKNSGSAGNIDPDTLILETRFETDEGVATLIDFMPLRNDTSDIVRLVVGESGRVTMCMELVCPLRLRLHRAVGDAACPTARCAPSPARTWWCCARRSRLHGENFKTVGEFTVSAGETVPFTLIYAPSHLPPPEPIDPREALADDRDILARLDGEMQSRRPVRRTSVTRSLITLKALTYAPTGGIVAAPTTSLPEWIGGVRNWDYRFCWLRDATLTLLALHERRLLRGGAAWREWLLRAVAGRPEQAQIMYGIAGERRLVEWEVPWLPGFRNSAPVRIGNGAHNQLQLDVYGEVMDALHQARRGGIGPSDDGWAVQIAFLQASRDRVDGARREHLGGAQRPPPLHLFQGDGLGRLRPRHQERRGISISTARSSAGASCAR